MTAEKKKEVLRVLFPVALISFIVVGSSTAKFRLLDTVYLGLIAYFFIRYVIQVKRRID